MNVKRDNGSNNRKRMSNGNGNGNGTITTASWLFALGMIIAVGGFAGWFSGNYLSIREHQTFLDSTNRDLRRLEDHNILQDKKFEDTDKRLTEWLNDRYKTFVSRTESEAIQKHNENDVNILREKKMTREEFEAWKNEREKTIDSLQKRIDQLYNSIAELRKVIDSIQKK
jgi:hypothetical protein